MYSDDLYVMLAEERMKDRLREAEQPRMLAKVRMEDWLREAEQARLSRAAKGPRKVGGWWLQLTLILSSLLALFTRPQS